MPTIDLVTMCSPKDIHKTYAGWNALIASHQYTFHETILVRQRCRGIEIGLNIDPSVRILESEDYPDIFSEFGIDVNDPATLAAEAPNNRYFWKYHSMNQFIGLKESNAEYIAFTDCDNQLRGDAHVNSWVERCVHILGNKSDVIMVCPSQSGSRHEERTPAISTCMFLCERQRFLELDYNATCPPDVELNNFYLQFEGRVWRYAQAHNVCRVMLAHPPLMLHLAW